MVADPPVVPALRERVTTALGTVAAGEHAPDQLKLIMGMGQPLAIDIETFGLGVLARRLKAVAIASAGTAPRADGSLHGHAVVLDPRADHDRRMFRWAMRTAVGEGRPLVLHNSTFDVPNMHLYRRESGDDAGQPLWDRSWCSAVDDTLIWARLAWPGALVPKSLDALTKQFLGQTDTPIKGLFAVNGWRSAASGYLHADLDLPAYVLGNGMDALATAHLRDIVRAHALDTLTEGHPFTRWGVSGNEALRLRDREQRINRLMLAKACQGLCVDMDYYTAFLDSVTADQERRAASLTAVGIRPGNSADLSKWAASVNLLGPDWPMNKTGPKMDKTRQDQLARMISQRLHDDGFAGQNIAETFREHKQTAKDLTDYLGKVAELAVTDAHGQPRIHPVTNLLAAVTGRMSMGNPPLHQFTGPARGMIVAEPGERLVSIDWSQIEPVIFANIAGDHEILAGYESGKIDFYEGLAQRAGLPRKTAKIIILAQLYGEGIAKLAADLGIDEDEARELRKFIFRALPASARLIQRYRDIAESYRMVFTLSGRILPIGVGQYGVEVHKGVNYPTQGGAYDQLAESIIGMIDAGLGDALYLTMHDESVCAESAAEDIRRIMSTPAPRLVELARTTGKRTSDPILRTDMQLMPERWEKV